MSLPFRNFGANGMWMKRIWMDLLPIWRHMTELGLDPGKEYPINHPKADYDRDWGNSYKSCLSQNRSYRRIYKSNRGNIRPIIDLLIPCSSCYTTLYTHGNFRYMNRHCYIYFTMDEALITIYKNGRILYSKSLEYS